MNVSKPEYRTPLARVRGFGVAKEGVSQWWAQRVTAVALVPLALWLILSLAHLAGVEHRVVQVWIARPVNTVLLVLLLGTMLYHAQLGLQVVVEDYVHGEMAKLAAIIAVRFAAMVVGVASLLAVLKIALTG